MSQDCKSHDVESFFKRILQLCNLWTPRDKNQNLNQADLGEGHLGSPVEKEAEIQKWLMYFGRH